MKLIVGKEKIKSYKMRQGEVALGDYVAYKCKDGQYRPSMVVLVEGEDFPVMLREEY